MKSSTTTWLAAVLFVLAFSTSAVAQEQQQPTNFETAAETGEAVVQINYYEVENFSFKEENGSVKGISIDILNQYFNYLKFEEGIDVTVEYNSFSDYEDFLASVENAGPGVFGAGNVTITEQRKDRFAFSPSYFTDAMVLVSNDETKDLEDLSRLSETFKGKTAVAIEGTLLADKLAELKRERFPSMDIMYVQNTEEVGTKVSENSDLFSLLDFNMYWNVQENHSNIKYHPASVVSEQKYGFIMPEDSGWSSSMDQFFKVKGGYTETMAYNRILAKYLDREMAKMLTEYAKMDSSQPAASR